ncbi:MAG: class I SAM-dependent methyltransferase [Acidobacteriia bacterium]|nr:class I SAM-dependent methyltransferase [Terriglobia bacterium]
MNPYQKPAKQHVREFWEKHPLCSYEIAASTGDKVFFEEHDRLKREDTDLFCMHLWRFDQMAGKKVLDVGCGPGWLVRNYARTAALIVGIDLTFQAAQMTKRSLDLQGLKGCVVQADAERLPFRSNAFDFVSSSGVLHHTPDTQKAISECHRTLKSGGDSVISLYYRNILLRRATFPLLKQCLRLLKDVPGRRKLKNPKSIEEFVRVYDGDDNPVGKAYSKPECREMFRQYVVEGMEIHFFPNRFLALRVPRFVHKLLDSWFGTMIYLVLKKSSASPPAEQ